MSLPPPDADALAVSAELSRRIRAEIAEAGGWIGFDRFMRRALYEPGLGYYASGAAVFGTGGDFVTAPELDPLFGHCVAAQLAQWFEQLPACVVEFGAGSGALAAQLLDATARLQRPIERYSIVEVSAPMRERQRRRIARDAPQALDAVEWLDTLPPAIDGVVIGNEVLDALPVRLFELQPDAIVEVGVTVLHSSLALEGRPADAAFAQRVRDRFAPLRAQHGGWPAGYRSELGEQADAWIATVAGALRRGAMLLFDYGFPARELYHPQRSQGTLMCHYRHRAHGDPLWHPGLQDVTAHVDFSAVARAATQAGLSMIGYTSQARFLLGCGILDAFAADAAPAPLQRARRAAAVQTLLSEAEMGELFKAIAFGRGVSGDAIGFEHGDRSASL